MTLTLLEQGGVIQPHDISADGNVIVGVSDLENKVVDGIFVGDNIGAFRYTTSEGLIELEMDDANAISADGSVIVGNHHGEAVRYTNSGGIVGLSDLPDGDFDSIAIDVSADGSVIVGNSIIPIDGFEVRYEAFIWDEDSDSMKSLYDTLIADGLDLSEWTELSVGAISDDGSTIVGTGNHNGNMEAFAARMFVVPVPAAVWLMGTALLGLLGFQRKHNR